jgi:hypothetical protein
MQIVPVEEQTMDEPTDPGGRMIQQRKEACQNKQVRPRKTGSRSQNSTASIVMHCKRFTMMFMTTCRTMEREWISSIAVTSLRRRVGPSL